MLAIGHGAVRPQGVTMIVGWLNKWHANPVRSHVVLILCEEVQAWAIKWAV